MDLTLKEYPRFKNFSPVKLEEFLEREPIKSWFSDSQKNELRAATDQDKYYMEALMGRYIDEAQDKHRLLLNYLIEHRIFMTDDLRTKLYDAQESLFGALNTYSIGKTANDWKMMREGQDVMLKMQTRIDQVEQTIQARLHYEDAY